MGITGVSIGSNDLTQLMLGVDRDSELCAELFDEADAAVLDAIVRIIRASQRGGHHVVPVRPGAVQPAPSSPSTWCARASPPSPWTPGAVGAARRVDRGGGAAAAAGGGPAPSMTAPEGGRLIAQPRASSCSSRRAKSVRWRAAVKWARHVLAGLGAQAGGQPRILQQPAHRGGELRQVPGVAHEQAVHPVDASGPGCRPPRSPPRGGPSTWPR